MYRLLIVTGNQNVNDMISGMQGWEKLGFKPPRLRATTEEAIECMKKHHIDAIAVDSDPAFEGMITHLDQNDPDLPIFQIAKTPDEQLHIMQEVSRLLNRLNADDSNDDHDKAFNMQLQRDRWMKKLVGGMISSREELMRQLGLYRLKLPVNLPCVLARLEMSDEDGFMSVRWHYGSDRLETALRNFFGHEYRHMLIHVVVVSPEEVRVLCYPSEAEFDVSENIVHDYMQETVEQIENYLGLHMNITSICRIGGICELCQ